jgi:hypothetical protein
MAGIQFIVGKRHQDGEGSRMARAVQIASVRLPAYLERDGFEPKRRNRWA